MVEQWLLGGGTNKAPQIFGDGSDGAVIISADTTWNAETEDTGMIVKQFESLLISEGVTVSAGNRNCGMIIRVQGSCTIAGTLENKLSCKTLLSSDNVDFSSWPLTMLSGKGGDGGKGGSGGYTYDGSSVGGNGMTGRFYGGGWSGGGSGGNGSGGMKLCGGSVDTLTTAVTTALFVGGQAMPTLNDNEGSNGKNGGGGAGYSTNNGNGGNGGTGAGAAGIGPKSTAFDACGGGGAGNYGGGVIILLVGGKLTISGTIDCSGGPGGDGGHSGTTSSSRGGSGGGGAGGGRIFVCYNGDINNTGTLNVSGGAAGAGGKNYSYGIKGNPGTAGTDGTTVIKTYDQYKREDVA